MDNASTDDTAAVVQQKQASLPITIRHFIEPRLGLHEGRHRGAREARADYVAYLDDDMVVSPQWLGGVRLLLDGTADAVVGRILPRWETHPPGWLLRMVGVGGFGYFGLLDLGESAARTEHFYGGNLFIRKRTVIGLGGFNPDSMPEHLLGYRGDGETGLWLKLRAAGMNLWYDPTAIAYHVIPPERMSVDYLRKRAYRQGISASFTDLRNAHGLGPLGSVRGWRVGNVIAWARRQELYMLVRHLVHRRRRPGEADAEVRRIQLDLSRAWARGWAYHRAAVRRDKTLRAHVLRGSFMDSDEGAPR